MDLRRDMKNGLFVILLALSFFVQLGFATDWNQTYFNISNLAFGPDVGPLNSTVVWNLTAAEIGDSHVVVSGGIAYVGSTISAGARGNLLALNASNGTLIWNYSNTTNIAGGMTSVIHHPVVGGGRVVFDHDGGNVYALNATTGQLLWNYSTANSTRAPAIADGVVYVSSFDGNLYALNLTSGTKLWNFSMPGRGNVYPPLIERLFDGVNGRWNHNITISNDVPAGVTGTKNETYKITSVVGDFSFNRLWNNSNFTQGTEGAAFSQNILYGNLYITAPDTKVNKIVALNSVTGAQRWNSSLIHNPGATSVAAVALIGANFVVVGTTTNANGTLFVLNAFDGSLFTNYSLGSGIAALRFTTSAADTNITYLTTTYSVGATFATNVMKFNAVTGQIIWNRSIGTNTPSITGGGPIIVDGALFMTTVATNNVISIDDTLINSTSPMNNFVTNQTRPEFNFTITNTTFGPRDCGLWVNGTEVALNESVSLNINTNLTPTSNLSNGTNVWFIRCQAGSIVRHSETRTLIVNISNQSGGQQQQINDTFAPALNLTVNASFGSPGESFLINATAGDNQSNVSVLNVSVLDPEMNVALACPINITNGSLVNVNCVFNNNTQGGMFIVNALATDNVGNMTFNTSQIVISGATPRVQFQNAAQGNSTVVIFDQIRPNYSQFAPIFGGANATDNTLELAINQTTMPIFFDEPPFAGPTTFENLAYNFTFSVNVSAGLANGTRVNLTVKTGANIPALVQQMNMTTPEGNITSNIIAPDFTGNNRFTIFTNNIRGVSNNNSGAVSGVFSMPSQNSPYTQANLTINASNSNTPYQINITLLFPSRGPLFIINQTYDGFNFSAPPPLGSVLNQSFHVDLNNSDPFLSARNIFIEFMFPANVTIYNSNGSVNLSQTIATNAQVFWFNFSSGAYENATGNLANYNITPITGCFNVTDNHVGSPISGKNVSPCLAGFRYNLGATNLSWRFGSRARLNVTASLNFSSLGESIVGNGAQGQTTQCNVTANVPVQGGAVTVPSSCAPNTCSASSLNVSINGQQLNSSQFSCGSIVITGASLNLGPNEISVSYFIPTAATGGTAVGGSASTQTISITGVEASCKLVKATISPTSGITTRLLYKSTAGYYIEVAKVPYGGTLSFNTNYSGAHQIEATGAGYLPTTRDVTVPACTVAAPTEPAPTQPTQPSEPSTGINETQPSEPEEPVVTPTEPTKPVEPVKPEIGVKEETLITIQAVQKDVETAKAEGKDVTKAQGLLDEALALYNAGDYDNARVKALEANRSMIKAAEPVKVDVPANVTQGQGAGTTSLLLPIIAIIGLVVVGAIAAYYLFMRKR